MVLILLEILVDNVLVELGLIMLTILVMLVTPLVNVVLVLVTINVLNVTMDIIYIMDNVYLSAQKDIMLMI